MSETVLTSPIILDATGQDMLTKLDSIISAINPVAQGVSYDNAGTGMVANNVQSAITELKTGLVNTNSSLTNLIGFYDEITMPYTPTKQGYLTMAINPSSSSGGYSVVVVTKGGVSKNFIVSTANGNGNTIGIIIPYGATLAQGNSNNVTITYRYAEIG